MKTLLKSVLATAAFGLLHSLLAADRTKQAAARRFGARDRAGLYRPFYIAQSIATVGALVLYIRSLPQERIWDVEGAGAAGMRTGQAASLVWATLAAGSVGILDVSGLRNLARWLAGRDPGLEPAAQGPAPDDDGGMHVTGPFRLTRHPLNFAPLPIMWLQPTMTTRLLGFNLAATAYLVLGSAHEENRLEARYGRAYRRYRESGVPFFVPGRAKPLRPAR